MSILIGYDTYGYTAFEDDSVSLTTIKNLEISSAIVDELSVRSNTAQGTSNVRETQWNNDQHIWATFLNTLEAGNLSGNGSKIIKFRIVRRLSDQEQNADIFLGEVPIISGIDELEFIDATQPNEQLTYTLIPVYENGLDGVPREVSVLSEFTGVWVVNRNTNEVLVFDKAIGSVGNVDSVLNQNRTQIDTFSKYPQFYYASQNYESFTLSTVVLPDEGERTGKKYKEIVDKFMLDHTPKLVKMDTGKILVADISNLRVSSPLNTWNNFDYLTISVDVTECEDYETYLQSNSNPTQPVQPTQPTDNLDGGTFLYNTTSSYDGGGF